MRLIELKRVTQSSEGTFGVLITGGRCIAVTIELPWKGNQKFVSSIPFGQYVCKRVESPKYGNTFQVMDVRGRTGILFHIANTVDDLEGCIGVGTSFGILHDKCAVLMSKDGFETFLYEMKDVAEFDLWITE